MALRQILLTRKIGELKAELETLRMENAALVTRRDAWNGREQAALAALEEITENATEEERTAFEAEVTEIEQEDTALRADETENAHRTDEATAEIERLEAELNELNKRGTAQKEKNKNVTTQNVVEINGGNENMNIRARITEIAANDEVRTFVNNVRENRASGITNAEYTIPTVMLPLLRETTHEYSKLIKHVNHQMIRGESRQNILAAAPEAVWTETVKKLNEVSFGFSQLRMDGAKLGAYIAVPNPYLEDSDENLASIIVDYLGRAQGYALDKAILYGTGKNMPVGIMTRLGETTQPSWWQTTQPAFTALNAERLGKLSDADAVKGVELYQEMMGTLGKVKQRYTGGSGSKFWAMSEETYIALQAELLSINAAGAIATGAEPIMPVLGGEIETLDFIPAGTIIGGYGNQYTLVERAGVKFASADQVMFIEDNTVFKSTSRWDGMPIAGEGFAAFSLSGTAPVTTLTFAEDSANVE